MNSERVVLFCAMVLVPLAFSGTASANASTIYDSVTGEQLVRIVQDKGYRAALVVDSGGDPVIDGTIEGTKFLVDFYDCDKATPRSCKSIQFNVLWNNTDALTEVDCNRFNTTYRISRMSIFDSKTIRLSMDVSATGVTEEYFSSVLDDWDLAVTYANRFFAKK